MLDWKRAAGARWVAEAPAGDDAYEVFAEYVAFTCDAGGAYDGGWSTDGVEDFDALRSHVEFLVRTGSFGFMGAEAPFELFRVGPGLDACFGGGGRGIAIACDWHACLGGEQVGCRRTCEEAMEAAEDDARARF